jgi:hypothetical protein
MLMRWMRSRAIASAGPARGHIESPDTATLIRTIPKSCEAVQALDMRAGIVVNVTRADRLRLEAIVLDRSAPQKRPP